MLKWEKFEKAPKENSFFFLNSDLGFSDVAETLRVVSIYENDFSFFNCQWCLGDSTPALIRNRLEAGFFSDDGGSVSTTTSKRPSN